MHEKISEQVEVISNAKAAFDAASKAYDEAKLENQSIQNKFAELPNDVDVDMATSGETASIFRQLFAIASKLPAGTLPDALRETLQAHAPVDDETTNKVAPKVSQPSPQERSTGPVLSGAKFGFGALSVGGDEVESGDGVLGGSSSIFGRARSMSGSNGESSTIASRDFGPAKSLSANSVNHRAPYPAIKSNELTAEEVGAIRDTYKDSVDAALTACGRDSHS